MIDYTFERAWTEGPKGNVDYNVATQGQVFWLPAKEELSEPVKRAHGKGAVEEGIYNHPVVAISRPTDGKDTIHFHLVSTIPHSARCPETDQIRSHLFKASASISCMPKQMSSMRVAARGICPLHQHPTTPTRCPKRRKSAFPLFNYPAAQLFDGTRT